MATKLEDRAPFYAARLFEAQEQGASDARLQKIAAEALKEVYFQDGGEGLVDGRARRAGVVGPRSGGGTP
ncbi:hypothetical protein ADK76_37915 [Streptomyces griseoflavus]|nr:hypothetical protein ADK76_37915 [Streptomyces griseoflavus]